MQLQTPVCVNLVEYHQLEKKMDNPVKKLYRSKSERMISGLCGGLAKYFNIDPTIVRLLAVVGFFITGSLVFWIYLVLWIVVPEEPIMAQE
jgi:phage shock protein PspC (stress-responsive transcriptional regulator)